MMELGRGGGTPRAGYLNPYQRLRLATYPNWMKQYVQDLEAALDGKPIPPSPPSVKPVSQQEELNWLRKRALAVQIAANKVLNQWGDRPPKWLQAEAANVADLSAWAMFCLDPELGKDDYILVTVSEASPSCQELPLKLSQELDRRCSGERVLVQCEW